MTIEDLLKIQKKAKRVYIIGSIITIIVALIVAFFTYFFSGAIIVLMFGIIIISIVNNKNKKEFQKGFKELFVLKALQSVFTDLVYKPEEGLDKRIISSTQMMDMGDVYDSNDYISGKYKNINIVQADVHIKEEREDSEGHTSYVTIFEGKWMIFDFNKYFMANVQVCQKGFYNNEVNQLFSKTKYKKVKMEDINFNNNFKVYAQDEHDAFYILTPSFMERLIKLTNSIKGKMLFCFIDDKLHIGLENGEDSFEHSIFKKINEDEIIEKISKEIKIITSFVDELSLDNDLFRKEK